MIHLNLLKPHTGAANARELRFESIDFSYGDEPVLEGIELTIRAGEVVALVCERADALLPGSRMSEVSRLCEPMLDAAEVLTQRYPGAQFLVPAASELIGHHVDTQLQGRDGLDCRVIVSRSKRAMAAADLVICASGTTVPGRGRRSAPNWIRLPLFKRKKTRASSIFKPLPAGLRV